MIDLTCTHNRIKQLEKLLREVVDNEELSFYSSAIEWESYPPPINFHEWRERVRGVLAELEVADD